MASILDEYELTVEKFESTIAVGMNMQQILTIFQMTGAEMDKWCQEHYNGCRFARVYEVIRQMTLKEYFDVMKELGYRGNPSALAIINTAIQKLDAGNTIKIVFENGGVKEENEEDKLNDEGD